MAGNKSKGNGGGKKPLNIRFVSPHPDGWANQKAGSKRATSVHPIKKEAEQSAREQSRKEGSELVIQNKNGRIGQKDSHGKDPFPPKG